MIVRFDSTERFCCLLSAQVAGVVGYFDHTAVPGDNHIGAVAHDEEVCSSA